MKRIFTLFVAIAFGIACMSAQAIIKFDKTSFNFGSFPEEQTQSTVFFFTNTGDEPLVLQQAMSTCGCTVADFTKTPIQPGKRGEVKVSYNGKGKPEGRFKKSITIRSNASNNLCRIYIEGSMTVKE